ncbi:MAG TPA: Spy/CpxP family protein refolding chaperone [Alloacidobacterium sp.]|nr:Spy/CpxP family protein refolding chaperone [Alloacidobacterium sp.]
MGGTSKFLALALAAGACMGGGRAVAQDWRPGPPPMERAFQGGHGRWWDDPKVAQQLNLTADQQKKMDDILQQHRLKLIDLNATLQKQETIMHPLMEADQPDEGKILAQIDAIAQARAELEKANARMLLGIRQVLTPDQWKKLKALREEGPRRFEGRERFQRRQGGPGEAPPVGGSPQGPPSQQ